ncbi:hypothetical protein PN441_09505 [Spirulina major CS-329]|uniref:hypothetical protein n=1 Tax=Spirulina TaxID=1154 RepID=UPI00232B49E1|nr:MULTISPECIES: hypothetical protein [Spirulina]MDB9494477.1 hypothetical protein [Spirulina subsalsa CS-330]MDB9503305.1 hypothetical protein [Spirulina major CS-329]
MPLRDVTELILKVFLGAAGISGVIKYVGPLVAIAPTRGHAIAFVALPPILLALLLAVRALRPSPPA